MAALAAAVSFSTRAKPTGRYARLHTCSAVMANECNTLARMRQGSTAECVPSMMGQESTNAVCGLHPARSRRTNSPYATARPQSVKCARTHAQAYHVCLGVHTYISERVRLIYQPVQVNNRRMGVEG